MPDETSTSADAAWYDVVIVGGGAAGLSAAVYTGRAGRSTLVLERSFLGGQIALTDLIANYPGFPEGIDGPELVQLMEKQARRFGAEIAYADVTAIEADDRVKTVRTTDAAYRTPIVILATGADPRKLGVPGEDRLRGKGVSYCGTCDGPFFRDQRVVVVGGGDSALKEALFLTGFASAVTIVHRRQGLRAEKIYQDRCRAHPKITFVLDAVVEEIAGDDHVEAVQTKNVQTGETGRIDTDGVFIFIGSIPNTGFLGEGFCEMDETGHLRTNEDTGTSVQGVYAVGDVRHGSYRQIATAVGEGVTAAMAAEHLLTDWGYEPGSADAAS